MKKGRYWEGKEESRKYVGVESWEHVWEECRSWV